jgi:hybrid cluster-associated redox disulfide protein
MRNKLNDDMTMDEIMRRWPGTIGTVLQFHMLCTGCPIASFHTVTEACREHAVDEDRFRSALQDAMDATA